MGKPKWILTAPTVPNPMSETGKGHTIYVYSDEELEQRQASAAAAGHETTARPYED